MPETKLSERPAQLSHQDRLNQTRRIASAPVSRCVVCGGESWAQVGSGQDFEYETCSNEWVYQACVICGHVQIAALPEPQALDVIYPSNYYSYVMDKAVHPLARWAKGILDRLKFRTILAKITVPQSYLDVGCGDGRYLELMIARGLERSRVYGVELDATAVHMARERRLQVERCRIEDAVHLPMSSFDLITMFHVIEHLARPDEVVRRIHELLGPGATLAIETPNFDSLDARLSRRRFWGGYHIPRHWHVFTPESLTRMLEQAGFSVMVVKYQPGHAFWLWTLHHWLKYGTDSPRLASLCHPLRNVPLLALVTGFDIVRAAMGFRTSAMLVLARKRV